MDLKKSEEKFNMSWKKHFQPVSTNGTASSNYGPISGSNRGHLGPGPARTNYSSYLPDIYVGAPNRVDRYGQYNIMDMDSEINAALDILAEFCTQKNDTNKTPFMLDFFKPATQSETSVINQYLKQWCKLQKFETRMFRIIRNVFKYGDAFFLRDPQTKKWFHVDPSKIVRIIVNESEGKLAEQYVVKDVNLNFKDMVATSPINTVGGGAAGGDNTFQAQNTGGSPGTPNRGGSGSRFQLEDGEISIDAEHIVHLSLSEGLDNNFPFGNSLLETIFKVYKQKELLEDAIVIYRVQRAPERRVFYVDVGNMPTHLAMSFVEKVKNEIHQRRIPSQTGGGQSVVDSSYNPLSINEDYFFPQTAEGRGSKVETLPGGTNLGEIDDLRYFTNKMVRGLRIPSSYLPTGADDSAASYNDGRVGTAFIQELRFNTYCERLQSLVTEQIDKEFKRYLLEQGLNVDTSMFGLQFQPPQNFAAYRQSELDNARIPTFTQMIAVPFISQRFAMKRYLGMTDEEIVDNERLWKQENDDILAQPEPDASADMRMSGVTSAGLGSDLDGLDTEMPDEELGMEAQAGEGPTSSTDAAGGNDGSGEPGITV